MSMFLIGVLCFVVGAAVGVFGNQLYWMGLFDDLINPDKFNENDAPRS